MSFGEVIRSARRRQNLTQSELAAKLKCTKTAVCKWEANKSLPPLSRFKSLAEALEISPDFLFDSLGRVSKPTTAKAAQIEPLFLDVWHLLTTDQRAKLLQIALILVQN